MKIFVGKVPTQNVKSDDPVDDPSCVLDNGQWFINLWFVGICGLLKFMKKKLYRVFVYIHG